jgi:hypothetical protein
VIELADSFVGRRRGRRGQGHQPPSRPNRPPPS